MDRALVDKVQSEHIKWVIDAEHVHCIEDYQSFADVIATRIEKFAEDWDIPLWNRTSILMANDKETI